MLKFPMVVLVACAALSQSANAAEVDCDAKIRSAIRLAANVDAAGEVKYKFSPDAGSVVFVMAKVYDRNNGRVSSWILKVKQTGFNKCEIVQDPIETEGDFEV